MFENWQKMVKEYQKRLEDSAKNATTTKNQKSTNLYGTKIEQIFIDDIDIWKKDDRNREQSSGCVFKEK